ncbi:MAG: TraR/DksA family transcriptional regulator [Chloroflexi bacterium]|nr:TraR/DksA family transcriptional regulator [Chloroflexota bacterium]
MSITISDDTHETARDRIRGERAKITARMQSLAQDALSFEPDADDVPPSGHERIEALSDAVSRRLSDIDRALARLDDGSYGICAGCGNAIPPRRLEVQPYAIFCVRCQAEAEKRGGRRGPSMSPRSPRLAVDP